MITGDPMDFGDVLQILASLEREQVDYAVFGGVALNFHGIVRATEDLDIFVRPEAENIGRLRRALRSVYDDPSIDEIETEALLGEYPSVRYIPPESAAGDFYLDILTRVGEFASFEDLEIDEIEFNGVKVRLVSPRTLYWMKRDTVRGKDRLDAEYLKQKFDLNDRDLAGFGGR